MSCHPVWRKVAVARTHVADTFTTTTSRHPDAEGSHTMSEHTTEPTAPSPATTDALPHGINSRLVATWKLLRDNYGMYEALFAEHGDPVRVHAFNADVYVTKTPEHIHQIFAQSPDDYDPFAVGVLGPLIGEDSVFVTHGAAHRAQRKLLMPPFHGERMRAYGEVMLEAARHQLATIPVGGECTAQEIAQKTSLEVIVRAVFGISSPDRVSRAMQAIEDTLAALHPLLLFVKGLQRPILGGGPWVKFQKALKVAEALLNEEIASKRAGDLGEDILSMLLQTRDEDGEPLSDETLRGHLFTLLVAGHETTGVALAWTMYHAHRHPQVLDTARAEIAEALARGDAPEALARLPYTTALWQESMRITPILPDIVRPLRAPMQLGPYTIPAGKAVGVAISALHHDPALYPDPETYRPERFLERKFKPWEYMPFGGGHRRCIGAAFASYELSLVLTVWLGEAGFELLDGELAPTRRNVTIAPEGGVRLRRVR